MTLIELMAASALAVLLMTASLGVIRSLVVQRRAVENNAPIEPWRRRLSEQLRWDLNNARKMCSRTQELRLTGYNATDFSTSAATHRPSEIIYSVRNEGDRFWLLRQEIHLDAAVLNNSRTEVVAADVRAMEINDLEKPDEEQNNNRKANNDGPVVYVSIPKQLHVVLHGVKENETILEESVVLQ